MNKFFNNLYAEMSLCKQLQQDLGTQLTKKRNFCPVSKLGMSKPLHTSKQGKKHENCILGKLQLRQPSRLSSQIIPPCCVTAIGICDAFHGEEKL